MTSVGYDPYFPSPYKRRVTARGAPTGHEVGAPGLGFKPSYCSVGSYASSRRSYPAYSSAELRLDQAAQVGGEFKALRTQEKAELQGLNDRFANFIDRVHELEQQNRLLEAELLLLRRRRAEPSDLRALYEREARRLRAAAEDARREGREARERRDEAEEALGRLRKRYEDEVLGRADAEGRLLDARKAADEATLGRAEREREAENLLDELAFARRLRDGEVAELRLQMRYADEATAETEVAKPPDLSAALRDIRGQYEKVARENLQSAEEWFCDKMAAVAVGGVPPRDKESAKDEAGECRRLLSSRSAEIDACREMNQALESQLQDVEERQSAEIAALQVSTDGNRRGGTEEPVDL